MKIHIVQKGDTLWNLSKEYNVDFQELKNANTQLSNPEQIMPGMKIKIPGSAKQVKKETTKQQTSPVKEAPKKPKKETQHPYKHQSPKPIAAIKEDDGKKKMKKKEELPQPQMPQLPSMPTMPILDKPKEEVKKEKPKVKQPPKKSPVKEKPKHEKPKEKPKYEKPKQEKPMKDYYAPIAQPIPCPPIMEPMPCPPVHFVPCPPPHYFNPAYKPMHMMGPGYGFQPQHTKNVGDCGCGSSQHGQSQMMADFHQPSFQGNDYFNTIGQENGYGSMEYNMSNNQQNNTFGNNQNYSMNSGQQEQLYNEMQQHFSNINPSQYSQGYDGSSSGNSFMQFQGYQPPTMESGNQNQGFQPSMEPENQFQGYQPISMDPGMQRNSKPNASEQQSEPMDTQQNKPTTNSHQTFPAQLLSNNRSVYPKPPFYPQAPKSPSDKKNE